MLLSSSYILQQVMMRTFSNAFECCFLMIGLYYWDSIKDQKLVSVNFALMTIMITLSFILRNSSAIPWIPLLIYKLFIQERRILQTITHGVLFALPNLLLSTYCDYLYYGKFTLVSWNFLKFNVITGGSDVFGTEPSINYLTQYLP